MSLTLDGTNGITLPTGETGNIGIGQTWQDVTASRALNTTYTNSSGKPIQVSLYASSGTTTGNTISLSVGGVVIASASSPSSGISGSIGQSNLPITVIVPSGATYIVSGTGAAAAINKMLELR